MLRPSLDDQNTTIRSARSLEACHVYLCSHPIPCGSLLMGLASSSTSQCGDLWHKHWVVIFDFGEREVYVCEATKDGTGELKGRGSWEEKTYVYKNDYSYEMLLGQYTILKEHVEKVVKKIRYMGKYHFKNNNCQKWAEKLLDHLEISVPRDMPDAQTVYEHAKPSVFAALSGIVGMGVSLLLGVVFRVHSKWPSRCSRKRKKMVGRSHKWHLRGHHNKLQAFFPVYNKTQSLKSYFQKSLTISIAFHTSPLGGPDFRQSRAQ